MAKVHYALHSYCLIHETTSLSLIFSEQASEICSAICIADSAFATRQRQCEANLEFLSLQVMGHDYHSMVE